MELPEMIDHTGTLEWILLSVFLAAAAVQWTYNLGIYLRFILYKPGPVRTSGKPVSVVICARNEADNLERFLPLVLQQDYPDFEVVVVDHGSTDRTGSVLGVLSSRFSNLRTTHVPVHRNSARHKKLALTIGLKSARYEHVVLTDADCYPVSDRWLRRMASNFTRKKKIVLGYGGYEREKGWLNLLIRYETVFTAIQYFSFAIRGRPYMGVGRNLGYERELFFKNKGFASHYHLASGDDDLFINEVATGGNTRVELSPESHTRSRPETSFGRWISQKQRHLTAGSHYSPASKTRLAGEWLSRIMLYASFIVLLCIGAALLWPVVILFVLLTGTRLVLFKLAMRRLDEKYLLLPSLLFDPVLPLVLGCIWFSNIFVTRYQPWS